MNIQELSQEQKDSNSADRSNPISKIAQIIILAMINRGQSFQFQFQIKHSHPRQQPNQQYSALLEQSKKSPILLNSQHNPFRYRLNAGATKEEYFQMYSFCLSHHKKKQYFDQKLPADASTDQILLEYRYMAIPNTRKIIGGSWTDFQKNMLLTHQIDVLYDGKQYRFNLSEIREEVIGKKQLQQKNQDQINQFLLNCIRIKKKCIYIISELQFIQFSEVYQTNDRSQIQQLNQFIAKCASDQEIDSYILHKLKIAQKDNKIKYEVELRLTEKGTIKIRQLCLKDQKAELQAFIDGVFKKFRSMQANKVIPQLQAPKLNQS